MSIIRPLYDWCLKQAEGKHAEKVLFGVAFAESSFFPLPPDILLLPMSLTARERAYRYALICTIGSVLGGLLGYAIGALFFATLGQWIVETYHLQTGFTRFQEEFAKYGVLIILAKGLTPIPFKLVTIASGVAGLNLPAFIMASIVTRGFRFVLVSFLAKRYGAPIKNFVEKYLTWVALGVLLLIAAGFWIVLR